MPSLRFLESNAGQHGRGCNVGKFVYPRPQIQARREPTAGSNAITVGSCRWYLIRFASLGDGVRQRGAVASIWRCVAEGLEVDADYFLKERTAFIRFFYETGVASFELIVIQIEQQQSPFDDDPDHDYENPEPPFLKEWMGATTAIEVHGQSSIALLSDSLKLYFETLRTRVIGFEWGEDSKRTLKKEGFMTAHKRALSEILQTDWSDCPVNFDIIEQVVLARNQSQHGANLTTLTVWHNADTLTKHPSPFFASEDERRLWIEGGGSPNSLFGAPVLKVSRASLFKAIEEIERLADWVESRLYKATEWRFQKRS